MLGILKIQPVKFRILVVKIKRMNKYPIFNLLELNSGNWSLISEAKPDFFFSALIVALNYNRIRTIYFNFMSLDIIKKQFKRRRCSKRYTSMP